MITTEKHPKTLVEAIRYFAQPEVALEFMSGYIWPEGPVCPACQGKDHYFLKTRQLWKCKGCSKQFSIKTNTVMEDSPLSLDKWIVAFWMILNAKNGVSSYELHRALGITQKSAWFMLHRIRHAMHNGSFTKMSGTVESDEAYIGGAAGNMHKHKRAERIKGTGSMGKAIVQGMLERGTKGEVSQVQTRVIKTARRPHVQDLIRKAVEPGSMLMTDSLQSYATLNDQYIHMTVNHAVKYAEGEIHTNGMENFWSLLKRTLNGTYVSVEPFHLFRYLDEQCFRFNFRKLNDAERFTKALGMMSGKRITYKELTGKTESVVERTGIQA